MGIILSMPFFCFCTKEVGGRGAGGGGVTSNKRTT